MRFSKMFDIPTLYLSSSVVAAVAIVSWLAFWYQVPEERSLPDWALASLCLGVGMVLIGLRNLIPDSLSIIAGNALLAAGIGYVYSKATRRLFNLPPGLPWHWINGAIAALGCTWFSVFQPDVSARIVLTSVLHMGALAAIAMTFWCHRDSALSVVHRATALVFGIGAVLLLWRAITAYHVPVAPDFTATPSIIIVLPNLYFQVFVLWLAITIPLGALTRLQGRVARARDEAEAASRAKSEFLSSMSHELRTPLNAVLGFAQLLQLDKSLGDDQRDSVREIVRGGNHLLELINDVLDLARIESGRLELEFAPVDLRALCEECRSLVDPLLGDKQLRLRCEIAPGPPLRADKVRLRQVLLNLLSNAIKYNREGGEVSISTSSIGPRRARVTVADTGVGIAPERLGEVFQPFNRLGAELGGIEGTGIGLTITQRLVRSMNGDVKVESVLGVGTSVSIDLPLYQE